MSRASELTERLKALDNFFEADEPEFKEGMEVILRADESKVTIAKIDDDKITVTAEDGATSEVTAKDISIPEGDRDPYMEWEALLRKKYPEAAIADKGSGEFEATFSGSVVGYFGAKGAHVV